MASLRRKFRKLLSWSLPSYYASTRLDRLRKSKKALSKNFNRVTSKYNLYYKALSIFGHQNVIINLFDNFKRK